MDRCDRSMMVIKRTIENNYDKFKTVGVFYLEKNAVLAEIAAKSEEEIAAIADECREMRLRRSFSTVWRPSICPSRRRKFRVRTGW